MPGFRRPPPHDGPAGHDEMDAAGARTRFWTSIGASAPDAVRPMFGSTIRDLPRWPQRIGYQVLGTPAGGSIVTTDGLSDDFAPDHPRSAPGPGFGLELFVHTSEPLTPGDAAAGWQMSLLIQAGHHAADAGDLRERLRRDVVVPLDLTGTNAPASHLDTNGQVTVLLGVADPLVPASFEVPSGMVLAVSIVPLTPEQVSRARASLGDRHRLAHDLTARRGGALAFYGATERWTR